MINKIFFQSRGKILLEGFCDLINSANPINLLIYRITRKILNLFDKKPEVVL